MSPPEEFKGFDGPPKASISDAETEDSGINEDVFGGTESEHNGLPDSQEELKKAPVDDGQNPEKREKRNKSRDEFRELLKDKIEANNDKLKAELMRQFDTEFALVVINRKKEGKETRLDNKEELAEALNTTLQRTLDKLVAKVRLSRSDLLFGKIDNNGDSIKDSQEKLKIQSDVTSLLSEMGVATNEPIEDTVAKLHKSDKKKYEEFTLRLAKVCGYGTGEEVNEFRSKILAILGIKQQIKIAEGLRERVNGEEGFAQNFGIAVATGDTEFLEKIIDEEFDKTEKDFRGLKEDILIKTDAELSNHPYNLQINAQDALPPTPEPEIETPTIKPLTPPNQTKYTPGKIKPSERDQNPLISQIKDAPDGKLSNVYNIVMNARNDVSLDENGNILIKSGETGLTTIFIPNDSLDNVSGTALATVVVGNRPPVEVPLARVEVVADNLNAIAIIDDEDGLNWSTLFPVFIQLSSNSNHLNLTSLACFRG